MGKIIYCILYKLIPSLFLAFMDIYNNYKKNRQKIELWNEIHLVAIGTTINATKQTTTKPIIILSLQLRQYIIRYSYVAF